MQLLPTSREVGSILYKGESGLHILWGENKNLFVPFFAMVSVDAPNNLNDCGIATDTRCRWGVCRFIIQNSEFRINHHLIHPTVVVLHTLEAPFAE